MALALLQAATTAFPDSTSLADALSAVDLWGHSPLDALLGLCGGDSNEQPESKDDVSMASEEGAKMLEAAQSLLVEMAKVDGLLALAKPDNREPSMLRHLRHTGASNQILATACAGIPALVQATMEHAMRSPTATMSPARSVCSASIRARPATSK